MTPDVSLTLIFTIHLTWVCAQPQETKAGVVSVYMEGDQHQLRRSAYAHNTSNYRMKRPSNTLEDLMTIITWTSTHNASLTSSNRVQALSRRIMSASRLVMYCDTANDPQHACTAEHLLHVGSWKWTLKIWTLNVSL